MLLKMGSTFTLPGFPTKKTYQVPGLPNGLLKTLHPSPGKLFSGKDEWEAKGHGFA